MNRSVAARRESVRVPETHLIWQLGQTLPEPNFNHPRKLLHRPSQSTRSASMLGIRTPHGDVAPPRSTIRNDDGAPSECEEIVKGDKIGRKGVIPPDDP